MVYRQLKWILQVADEISADLIIMGSHGRTGLKKSHARQRSTKYFNAVPKFLF